MIEEEDEDVGVDETEDEGGNWICDAAELVAGRDDDELGPLPQ